MSPMNNSLGGDRTVVADEVITYQRFRAENEVIHEEARQEQEQSA